MVSAGLSMDLRASKELRIGGRVELYLLKASAAREAEMYVSTAATPMILRAVRRSIFSPVLLRTYPAPAKEIIMFMEFSMVVRTKWRLRLSVSTANPSQATVVPDSEKYLRIASGIIGSGLKSLLPTIYICVFKISFPVLF